MRNLKKELDGMKAKAARDKANFKRELEAAKADVRTAETKFEAERVAYKSAKAKIKTVKFEAATEKDVMWTRLKREVDDANSEAKATEARLKREVDDAKAEAVGLNRKLESMTEAVATAKAQLKEATSDLPLQWFCRVDEVETRFPLDVNSALSAGYNADEPSKSKSVSWSACRDGQQFSYVVDWVAFEQVNTKTGARRPISFRHRARANDALDDVAFDTVPETLRDGTIRYSIDVARLSKVDTMDMREVNFALGHLRRLKPDLTCHRVDVYFSPNVKAAFEATKREFKARGLGTTSHWVFHGTDPRNIEPIMCDGFKVGGVDEGIKVAHGSSYGYGVYTAAGPAVPLTYSGGHTIILAAALEGSQSRGKTPACDSWAPQEDWVIFNRGGQLHPKYVIHTTGASV